MSVSVIQCITRLAPIVENSSRWDSRGRSLPSACLVLSSGAHFRRWEIHHPVPLHLQKAYEQLGYGVGKFPVAEAPDIVSLPMFPTYGELPQLLSAARCSSDWTRRVLKTVECEP